MKTIEETLLERGNNYGSFDVNVEAVAKIMSVLEVLKLDKDCMPLTEVERANLSYIVIKLVRLGATPNHIDSWHDLQGYAKLSENYFKGLEDDY